MPTNCHSGGALGKSVRELVEKNAMQIELGFTTTAVSAAKDGIVLHSGPRQLQPVDEIITVVGLKPDLQMLRGLNLDIEPRTRGRWQPVATH